MTGGPYWLGPGARLWRVGDRWDFAADAGPILRAIDQRAADRETFRRLTELPAPLPARWPARGFYYLAPGADSVEWLA